MSHSPRLPAPRNNKGETHLKTPSDSRAESQVSISQILSKLLRRPKRPMMDFDYYYKSSHVPAFGSWDWNQDLPFTQCFQSARQAGLLRYSYSEDRDLYVAGDLYENDVVTPAMIVVPRRRAKTRHPPVEEAKEQSWVASEVKEPASPAPAIQRPTPKPVDEDLYKISPELLYAKTKKKRGLGFFSSCLLPTCVL